MTLIVSEKDKDEYNKAEKPWICEEEIENTTPLPCLFDVLTQMIQENRENLSTLIKKYR